MINNIITANNMVILKMVILFTISLPELYPVSVLQNFMSALLTGCVIVILQMIKTSLQLMEKRSGILMIKVVAGERAFVVFPDSPRP